MELVFVVLKIKEEEETDLTKTWDRLGASLVAHLAKNLPAM